jgi:hypothetical protein
MRVAKDRSPTSAEAPPHAYFSIVLAALENAINAMGTSIRTGITTYMDKTSQP